MLGACDSSVPSEPKRKVGIPKDAVWAGGIDGGSWILCSNQKEFKYDCTIYNDHTGELMARGTFLHRRVSYNISTEKLIVEELKAEKTLPSYSYYDGDFIRLDGNEALVPDGWIIWPFDEGHGKKQFYENGVAIGEEIQY